MLKSKLPARSQSFKLKTSKKGQVVIPKPIRDELGESFIIRFDEDHQKWELVNIKEMLDSFAGSLQTGVSAQQIKDQIRAEEREREIRKFGI
jgi:bifunctional DNA-binding transcriptional regulator/antitoxin component of YhaV-PrlF toxin-antitoxin module